MSLTPEITWSPSQITPSQLKWKVERRRLAREGEAAETTTALEEDRIVAVDQALVVGSRGEILGSHYEEGMKNRGKRTPTRPARSQRELGRLGASSALRIQRHKGHNLQEGRV